MKKCVLFFGSVFPVIVNISFAQETREQQAKKTEVWSPVPPIITPFDKTGGTPTPLCYSWRITFRVDFHNQTTIN